MFLFAFSIYAQIDTMLVLSDQGAVKYIGNPKIDSIANWSQKYATNSFTDPRDSNVYQIVTIGSQIWMAENLRFLPSIVGGAVFSEINPCYYVYGYDGTMVSEAMTNTNYSTYGVLYNWSAAINRATISSVNPGRLQGVCPTGWHLPSETEWTELTDFLGGTSVAGGKLKEIGESHWISPNIGATDEFGFKALPGGGRNGFGSFMLIGANSGWWSASIDNSEYPWTCNINNFSSNLFMDKSLKKNGLSVRCLKDLR